MTRILIAALVVVSCFSGPARAQDAAWKLVKVPEVWKRPPADRGGYLWYRCSFQSPSAWRERKLELYLEGVDDARQIYLNGQRVANIGSFPPNFRSGLGAHGRHAVAGELLRTDKPNVLAIRVYSSNARRNFNAAAPTLFVGDEALHLSGRWQYQPGDDQAWRDADKYPLLEDEVTFADVQPAAEVEEILKRLPGEDGPLAVEDAVKRLKVLDGLTVEPVLAEPHIGQPLFIDFDERGRLWVMNYKQYPNPAGLTAVSRDAYLRSVYDKLPQPPPNHFPGADQITIHEDTDGDGTFDKHKTFVEGLSLATSFARGRGGLFVLNPPYLLFYPDKDNDDVPDGDPEVLLEGFGIEDSHSCTNNMRWGPDGWLYASQGSTVTGQVKRYGSKDEPVHSMGQLIWRYHPERKKYEIFAEGGGNSFGVEIDSKGRVYSGHNGGNTRGFHYVQGGYYQKSFGKHGSLSNPYTFGHFAFIEHHSVPRFTHQFVIYEGATLPKEYHGQLFGVGPLQGHVMRSSVTPKGSSFKTADIDKALLSSDPWFRPVHIKVGPDGALYVCDFYEQRIDHASHYQGRVTPETGRIYRIRTPDLSPAGRFDYAQLKSDELFKLLEHPNKWHRQIALRLLADRRDLKLAPKLIELLGKSTGQVALEYLWAINLSGGFTDGVAAVGAVHPDPYVRLWTIRLACDDGQISDEYSELLALAAESESYVEVRCQLACSARRLPARQGLAILRQLIEHDGDAGDVFNPLLIWWAIEAKADSDRDEVVDFFADADIWSRPLVGQHLLERVMRRYALAGTQLDLLTCAKLLQLAPTKDDRVALLKGFEAAFSGRSLNDLPDELIDALAKAGGGSVALRLRRADPAAVREALAVVQDETAAEKDRIEYTRILGEIGEKDAVVVLLALAKTSKSNNVRSAALTSLQSYADDRIGKELTAALDEFADEVRDVGLTVLSSRRAWAAQLLSAVEAEQVAADSVDSAVVQRILFHDDEQLAARVQKVWGDVGATSATALRAEVQRLESLLADRVGNPYRGKVLYKTSCGKCHVLFAEGGQIGPDLTPFKRDDLRGMLLNVVNPSLEIREGFENFVVFTDDGRTLNGFVEEQDNRVVVLKGADGQRVIIPRDEIDEMSAIKRSIMPEGLLKPFNDQQIRDLFAYLRSTQPLP